ncbi:MAG: tRNA preQ1(34) S-adenosylmethionine ribosyltransferase-isomerase QueA [Myxococcota bacterium]
MRQNLQEKQTRAADSPGWLDDYAFDLPQELIAQHPLPRRTASRLLVLARGGLAPRHVRFVDIVGLLRRGDVLVLNDTRVFPARLIGRKIPGGGRVELLLCRAVTPDAWVCLLQMGSGRARVGQCVRLLRGDGQETDMMATLHGSVADEPGAWHVRFDGDALRFACEHGRVPLPTYMRRKAREEDNARYQTVFARPEKPGSCAAPTAGLHFDHALLRAVRRQGVRVATVTLHVGPGTFAPVRAENIDDHVMHPEPWWLSQETADQLNACRARGGHIVAVGTTVVRVLETAVRQGRTAMLSGDTSCKVVKGLDNKSVRWEGGHGLTRLFIRPGFRFAAVDAVLTNFHLPKSTLLMLVAAAVGRERLLAAYREAIRQRYRFFSYGDACFIEVIDSARDGALLSN